MPFPRSNNLDQFLDVAGSLTKNAAKTLSQESAGLGEPVSAQTGAVASVGAFAAGISNITGLTGMTANSPGRFLTTTGAASAGNNGTFLIVAFVSATEVRIANSGGVSPDANDGAISWTEREPYTLEDDLNFERTDRAAIKGVAYDAAIPTYQRPTAVGTNVPANLSNVAGKTTDALALNETRKFENVTVAATDTFATLTDAGNLKHADAVNTTGVPINDGLDVGNDESTYVEIINPATEAGLEVLADPTKRVYGRARAGSGVSPNAFEVEFRKVTKGSPLSTSAAYTWEAGQPTVVDMFFAFRQRSDLLNENAFRRTLVHGIVGDADLSQDIVDVRTVIGVGDNVTDLSALLTNTGNYFPFVNLPDGTPSVVEALNTLNAQVGNRDFSGAILSDGQTVTASLQALANAIAGSSVTRVIERLAADANANVSHILPGGNTYTLDGTGHGANLWVYWRGLLKHPGTLVSFSGNEYAETDTTHITPYSKIKSGEILDYFILQ